VVTRLSHHRRKIMAKVASFNKTSYVPGSPKKTRQGRSQNTHLGSSSRNGRKKRYRGQGK
jgi:hypothetical protein